MLFNSYEFLFLFLPITFIIYFLINKLQQPQWSKIFLVAASLCFYSWWNLKYLPLILLSIVVNYFIAAAFDGKSQKSKKIMLWLGLLFNIGMLCYFKYADFFIENFNWAFDTHSALLHIALPLAISFFTFQQVSYLVDAYRGETEKYGFIDYCVFVTFFPQLIAGPIIHHKEMMPQFADAEKKRINYHNIAMGLYIFSIGLFKKTVIADTFAPWVNNGFDVSEQLNLVEAWATSLSYTFQLYFDFSGYADMAIGAALLFNIRLPINFNSPLKAVSVQDYWRRWHVTLGRFLRNYIYIPLGGNRKGNIRLYTNLMITLLIAGFWHGPAWTFVIWGFLHAVAMIVHKFFNKLGFTMNFVLAWLITFLYINMTRVFFRSEGWDDISKIFKGMLGFNGIYDAHSTNIDFNVLYSILLLFIGFVLVLCFKNSNHLLEKKEFKGRTAVYYALMFMVAVLWISVSDYSEFIYFNF